MDKTGQYLFNSYQRKMLMSLFNQFDEANGNGDPSALRASPIEIDYGDDDNAEDTEQRATNSETASASSAITVGSGNAERTMQEAAVEAATGKCHLALLSEVSSGSAFSFASWRPDMSGHCQPPQPQPPPQLIDALSCNSSVKPQSAVDSVSTMQATELIEAAACNSGRQIDVTQDSFDTADSSKKRKRRKTRGKRKIRQSQQQQQKQQQPAKQAALKAELLSPYLSSGLSAEDEEENLRYLLRTPHNRSFWIRSDQRRKSYIDQELLAYRREIPIRVNRTTQLRLQRLEAAKDQQRLRAMRLTRQLSEGRQKQMRLQRQKKLQAEQRDREKRRQAEAAAQQAERERSDMRRRAVMQLQRQQRNRSALGGPSSSSLSRGTTVTSPSGSRTHENHADAETTLSLATVSVAVDAKSIEKKTQQVFKKTGGTSSQWQSWRNQQLKLRQRSQETKSSNRRQESEDTERTEEALRRRASVLERLRQEFLQGVDARLFGNGDESDVSNSADAAGPSAATAAGATSITADELSSLGEQLFAEFSELKTDLARLLDAKRQYLATNIQSEQLAENQRQLNAKVQQLDSLIKRVMQHLDSGGSSNSGFSDAVCLSDKDQQKLGYVCERSGGGRNSANKLYSDNCSWLPPAAWGGVAHNCTMSSSMGPTAKQDVAIGSTQNRDRDPAYETEHARRLIAQLRLQLDIMRRASEGLWLPPRLDDQDEAEHQPPKQQRLPPRFKSLGDPVATIEQRRRLSRQRAVERDPSQARLLPVLLRHRKWRPGTPKFQAFAANRCNWCKRYRESVLPLWTNTIRAELSLHEPIGDSLKLLGSRLGKPLSPDWVLSTAAFPDDGCPGHSSILDLTQTPHQAKLKPFQTIFVSESDTTHKLQSRSVAGATVCEQRQVAEAVETGATRKADPQSAPTKANSLEAVIPKSASSASCHSCRQCVCQQQQQQPRHQQVTVPALVKGDIYGDGGDGGLHPSRNRGSYGNPQSNFSLPMSNHGPVVSADNPSEYSHRGSPHSATPKAIQQKSDGDASQMAPRVGRLYRPGIYSCLSSSDAQATANSSPALSIQSSVRLSQQPQVNHDVMLTSSN
uniref:PEHE domain-containing protein n=1 Tax=Macrostomum lignano TaxID=282301 RepID=A0A1I8J1X8_9PLAT